MVIAYFSGIIMAVSTALFGLYFKMVLPHGNNSSNANLCFTLNSVSPGTENSLSWLAVVSLGLFVAGEWNKLLSRHYMTLIIAVECDKFVPYCHIIDKWSCV